MKFKQLFIAFLGIIVFSSCKSLKSLASKDNSTTTKNTTVKAKTGKVTFIDNIEVTPGTVVTSKHRTINTRKQERVTKKAAEKSSIQTVEETAPNKDLTKVNIEHVDELQLKYAILLDATVEKLNNILMLQTIEKWYGTRYRLGGTSLNGVDCSGFSGAVAKTVYQLDLARTAQEQYNNSNHIDMSDLEEGDLVFFSQGGRKGRVSHVGVYLMNNKFVHASTSHGVMISDLNDSYWQPRIRGAGRIRKVN